ncbi:hypothetical protein M5D96_010066 [Drosophila gunungcola]|uniref:Uncharacterized protein n=1 Tax=Drosophila gunungcola TaxID=103775 RepID=A0A9P9YHY1_9MUSC|nr:hypothetical protein M5D96_010066 [Drosophila gunungcola]
MQLGEQGQDDRSERCFHSLQPAIRRSVDPSIHGATNWPKADSIPIHDIFGGKPGRNSKLEPPVDSR